MKTVTLDHLAISSELDIVNIRQRVRLLAVQLGFTLVEQTKLVTAASELLRNMYTHAGGGSVTIEEILNEQSLGMRIIFEDHGPGIPDIELAMQDGYSTNNSMGKGLPGARRLVHNFEIASEVGKGTKVVITEWKENASGVANASTAKLSH